MATTYTVKNALSAYKANPNLAPFLITDTVANVGTNIDSIETIAKAGKIVSISLSGTATLLSISGPQYVNDIDVLRLIISPYTLKLSAVTTTQVNSNILSDTHIVSIAVTDSSTNIAKTLDLLQTNIAKITGITQSGTASAMGITYTQWVNDAKILAKITNTYTLNVSDVAAGTAKTVTADTHVKTILVVDSSTSIATNLDALQALGTKVTSITQSGTPTTLSITSAQLTKDAATLNKIAGAYTLAVTGVTASGTTTVSANTHVVSLSVSDTSANITTNLNALQALGSKLAAITQTGTLAALKLTASQVNNDAGALGKITNAYTLAVTDSSANIATYLNALQDQVTKLASITQSGTTSALNITGAQYLRDQGALAKITGTYTEIVSGLVATSAATAKADTHVVSFTVSDTGANLALNLDALNAIGAKLTLIQQTDSTAIFLTYAQYIADTNALAKLSGAYTLTVTDVSAANAATVAADGHVASITLLANSSLTETQFNSLHAKITNTDLTVTDVAVADIVSIASSAQVAHFSFTGSTIKESDILPALNDVAAKMLNTHVTITDVAIVQDAPNHRTSFAIGEASDSRVDKVILAPSIVDSNGTPVNGWMNAPGTNFNINLPWINYSQYSNTALHKIFAADGVTNVVTKINDVDTLDHIKTILSTDSSVYGASLLGADTSYTEFSAYKTFHIGSLGTANLEVLDVPSSVFLDQTNIFGQGIKFDVVDSAENISANLASLVAHASEIVQLKISGQGSVDMSQVQFDALKNLILDGTFSVLPAGPQTMSVAQLESAIGSLTGEYLINVEDSSENIFNGSALLTQLGAHLNHLTLDDYPASGATPTSFYWQNGAFSSFLNAIPALGINSVTVEGVNVVKNLDGTMSSRAWNLSILDQVDKVILSHDIINNTGLPTGTYIYSDGINTPSHEGIGMNSAIPWLPYSTYLTHPLALDKIFAADGLTPVVTALTNFGGAYGTAINELLANDSSLYGLIGPAGVGSCSYTNFDNYVKYNIGSLGQASYVVVVDTPLDLSNVYPNSNKIIFNPVGTSGDDVIIGSHGSDTVWLGAGSDTVSGGEGHNEFFGGSGNDTYLYNFSGQDIIIDSSGENDTLILSGVSASSLIFDAQSSKISSIYDPTKFVEIMGQGSSGRIENIQYNGKNYLFAANQIGTEGDDFIGGLTTSNNIDAGAGSDVVFGGSSDDIINGGDGDDIITGVAGADLLTGGSGNNVFKYSTPSDSQVGSEDSITDFKSGQDKIDLSAIRLVGDAPLTYTGNNQSINSVWYEVYDGYAMIKADCNGDQQVDMAIKLIGVNQLAQDDIILQ